MSCSTDWQLRRPLLNVYKESAWTEDGVDECYTKMNLSNTHWKPILLYCSRPTQTHDNSESEDSDFPPCWVGVGNSPPLISRSPLPVPRRSCYLQAAENSPQQLATSSEDKPHQSQRRGQLNKGVKELGQTNVINTVDAVLKVFINSLVLIAMLMLKDNVRLIILFTENTH